MSSTPMMPTTKVPATLQELPQTTRALARATITATRGIVAQSAAQSSIAMGIPQCLFAVRQTRLNLYFLLARKDSKVILFFIKKQRAELHPLEARLQVVLQAAEPPSPADAVPMQAPALRNCGYRWVVPPFLIARPSRDELDRYAPSGATAQSVILLRVSTQPSRILAIANPEADGKAAAVYTAQTRQTLDRWPVEPFLAFIETLRTWIKSGMPATEEIDLALPTLPLAMSDLHATLHWIGQAYCSLAGELAGAQVEPIDERLKRIVPSYEVKEYSAVLSLCVDGQGQLASGDETQTLSVSLNLMVRSELGAPVARIAPGPPDFLVAGALRDAFITQLQANPTARLLKALGMQSDEWSSFLDSASERTVVFRIERSGDSDVDVIVLPGIWREQPRTLILRAGANVDVKAQPIVVKLSTVSISYDSQSRAPQFLDAQAVTYFLRLSAALKSWLTVIGQT